MNEIACRRIQERPAGSKQNKANRIRRIAMSVLFAVVLITSQLIPVIAPRPGEYTAHAALPDSDTHAGERADAPDGDEQSGSPDDPGAPPAHTSVYSDNKAAISGEHFHNAECYKTRADHTHDSTCYGEGNIATCGELICFTSGSGHTLTIAAAVKGIFSDTTKDFTFWLYVADSEGLIMPAGTEYAYLKTGQGISGIESGKLTLKQSDGGTRAEFMLADGQTIKIQDIPKGHMVRVMEDWPPDSPYNVSYLDSADHSNRRTGPDTGGENGEMLALLKDHIFYFINDRNNAVPISGINTGHTHAVIPLVILTILATITFMVFETTIRRRRRSEPS